MQTKLDDIAAASKLPACYVSQFCQFVAPVIDQWLNDEGLEGLHEKPSLIGFQGCQGSGKSTLCEFIKIYIEECSELSVAVCSLDDFYLTQSERVKLSESVHPLLATRGVPGTHDTHLINSVFDDFANKKLVRAPVFDKSIDDRAPEAEWQNWTNSPSLLIFEGWCVGVPPQITSTLDSPVNDLESKEDKSNVWRCFVNHQLETSYKRVFEQFDKLFVLQAPSFDCVFEWRALQEQRLLEHVNKQTDLGEKVINNNVMNEQELVRFISHYQRLTEHALDVLPTMADATLYLNSDHSFDKMVAQ